MAMLLVTCEKCGKKLKLDEKRVGTVVNCPTCRSPVDVPPAGSRGCVRMRPQAEKSAPTAVSINWLPIFWIAVAVIIVGSIATIYFGPVRARHQWEEMVGSAEETIQDVVQHGLAHVKQAETKELMHGELPSLYKPPSVVSVHTYWQGMVMSMPAYVEFTGVSSEGNFKGKYYTKTGEVVAKADMGAPVLANLVATREGSKKLDITGRKKDGVMTVEVDGASIP